MNIIENNQNEEYRFTLSQEDRDKLNDVIDTLLDQGKDIKPDIVRIAITLRQDGDKAFTTEKMCYSHYTFDTINALLKL